MLNPDSSIHMNHCYSSWLFPVWSLCFADRAQLLVAARVVVFVVNDNALGGDVVVLMVGCLVEFVKEYCNQENIGVLGVLLLIVP